MMKKIILTLLLISIFEKVSAKNNWLDEVISKKENSGTLGLASKHFSSTNSSASFFNSHALIFIFASTCPHCHRFAPIVKYFSEKNQARVLAISLNNTPLEEFPDFKKPSPELMGATFGGQAITYPALFLLNKNTKAIYPVSVGSMTSEELNDRMAVLIPKIVAYESKGPL